MTYPWTQLLILNYFTNLNITYYISRHTYTYWPHWQKLKTYFSIISKVVIKSSTLISPMLDCNLRGGSIEGRWLRRPGVTLPRTVFYNKLSARRVLSLLVHWWSAVRNPWHHTSLVIWRTVAILTSRLLSKSVFPVRLCVVLCVIFLYVKHVWKQ